MWQILLHTDYTAVSVLWHAYGTCTTKGFVSVPKHTSQSFILFTPAHLNYLPQLLTRKLVSKCGQQRSKARQNSLKASYPFSESISTNTSARWRASGWDRISHSSAYVKTDLRIKAGSTSLTSKSTVIAERCLESRRETPYSPAILVTCVVCLLR